MPIPDTEIITLLDEALSGQTEALIKWIDYTNSRSFNEEQISQVLKTIDGIVANSSTKNSNALFLRGLWLQEGIGGKINTDKAIKFYHQAIELGHSYAMNNRALMHQYGIGGNINIPEAVSLFEDAIKLNNASAMDNLAHMHQYGHVTGERNYPEAIRLYDDAIKLGNARAMQSRAYMYQHGIGGDKNYPAAIKLYEDAIKLGNVQAMRARAFMHRSGQGGNKNYRQALVLYKQYEKATGQKLNLQDLYKKIIADIKKNNKELTILYERIDDMYYYGQKIGFNKGEIIRDHTQALKNKLEQFLIDAYYQETPNLEQELVFKDEFKQLLNSQEKRLEIETHREAWRPIIANILLALTGIGLLAIIAKVVAHAVESHGNKTDFSMNKAFFFAKTHSQILAEEIEKANDWSIQPS
ncbi:tetratricopeptide repeat protein [Legionella cardiaca]|uniref:Tetratricopeptide repeat protein n=1 Tax=Legionella cardiaca TaxID=1071983 RepID=A0ABY8AQK3_9GAMM|nr:tetratricopeptide repeat protein [Legionella cardiaca]WED42069.1 tetratricopeptide repeat protein [Legionella cardiaca]